MEYGHLERVEKKGKPVVFYGDVAMQGLAGELYLIPHKTKRTDKSPDYCAKMRGRDGEWYPVGNAWVKIIGRGDQRGKSFFSITFDGPGINGPIYLQGFPDEEQPKDQPADKPAFYTLKWGRSRGGNSSDGAVGPSVLEDEIPY